MSEKLKVLILEDMNTDQELIKRHVLKFNPNSVFTIARDKAAFYEKIDWISPDIILSDFRLPDVDFTGLDALQFVKEKMPDVPFVFVTGTLNDEEAAAGLILKGADGYLLKDHLEKLPELVQRVLEENAHRIKKKYENARIYREKRLRLEKAYTLVTQASDFETKPEILKLLKEIRERLIEF